MNLPIRKIQTVTPDDAAACVVQFKCSSLVSSAFRNPARFARSPACRARKFVSMCKSGKVKSHSLNDAALVVVSG